MGKGVIYTLSDPRTGFVRYVGKTVRPLGRRLSAHLRDVKAQEYGHHAACWIRSLLAVGVRPVIEPLEDSPEDIDEAERFYIAYLRFLGCDLTNSTPGGDGGSHKGRRISTEHRARLSEAARTAWQNPVIRDAQVAAIRTAASTPCHRARVSAAQKAAWARAPKERLAKIMATRRANATS